MPGLSLARRRSLRLIVDAAIGVAMTASAFSTLAQEATSTLGVDGYGTPSGQSRWLGTGATRVALLVPPLAGVYGRASQALTDGVKAAQERDGAGIAVEVIEVAESGNELRALCDRLANEGFRLAIGPLTRNAVTALALDGAPALPVLALNQPDTGAIPADLIVFGLSIENEAQQAATYAWQAGLVEQPGITPKAVILHDSSPVSLRSAAAFVERWQQYGGEYFEPLDIEVNSPRAVRALLGDLQATVWFVALPVASAAAVRAVVGDRGTIYGTSMLNSGAVEAADERAGVQPKRTPELDGIRVVTMPWQVEPDSPAVMAYPRLPTLGTELQKLYALGIDSFRLGKALLAGQQQIDLDGVTGHLHLDLSNSPRVERRPMLAEYRDGLLQPMNR